VKKDRTNTLPKEFVFTYEALVKYFGMEDLNRAPQALRSQENLNVSQKRTTVVSLGGKDVKTAGVTGETLTAIITAIKGQAITESALRDKLNDDYSVTDVRDLREDEGKIFLNDIVAKGIPTVVEETI
jgi:hypothetical protein